MPVSLDMGKPYIRNIVGRVKHDRMLDIGPGSGTYAKLFPKSEWTGIEIYDPYVEKYGLKNLYKNIIVDDIRSYAFPEGERYDVAIAGDVLEHMTAEEAVAVLDKIKSVSDTVIVSIPIGHHPQGECEGNPHEAHIVDDWTDERVREVFGDPTWGAVDGCIGVYCWSNQKVMPRICVYAISKNESKFVKRFAESARDADLIVVADTGSTDNTIEECKANGIQVHSICITPWRFDHARNAAIALIPRDIDICISLDLDEVMEPGWRQEIEKVWTPETTRLSYFFDWGCGIKFRYEKIHARHGYFWHHPCHEYPVYDKRITEIYAHTDKLLVSHHPDPTKSRGQYMDLLELSVKEDPNCPRNAFYYARELSFNFRWHEAIEACQKYLALPGANWANERCYAYRVMGKCYEEIAKPFEAEGAYHRAASEAPNTREPWCELAMLMYRQSRWEECFAYSMRALKICHRELVYTCDPTVWGHWPHDLAAISAWNMGLKDTAIEQARLAVRASPNDQRLINNLNFMEKSVSDEVPNDIHMIYFQGSKSRDFSYINYLAVRAAKEVQNPDNLYIYYNKEPENNPNWENAKKYATLVKVEAPEEYRGVSLNDWPQYQSDVFRLQKLYDAGGIYLDTDAILTKPLAPFMKDGLTMSGHVAGYSKEAGHEVDSIPVATILAKPKNEFIRIWLDRLADGLSKNIWAWHAVNLPVNIYKERPELLNLQEMSVFLPFDFNDDRILTSSGEESDAYIDKISNSYVVHMWESVWTDKNKMVNEEFMSLSKSPFSVIFRKYAAEK